MDGPEPPSTNPELAALLAAAYRDVDTLRKHVASLQKRADKGDRFAEVIHALGGVLSPDESPSSSPQGPTGAPATNGSANPTADTPSTPTPATTPATLPGLHSLPPQFAQQLRQVVEMYEEKLAHVQGLLEESEARNKESWRQLDEILSSFQSHIHGARAIARTYVVDNTNGNHGLYTLGYTYTDSPTSAAFPSGAMGPPAPHHGHGHGASSSTSSSRHTHSGSGGSGSGSGSRALNATASSTGTTTSAAVAFPLPPHPPLPHSASTSASMASLPHSHGFPAPQHQAAGAGGVVGAPTRRPRTPSMDNLYASAQPPSKRSRAAAASMIEDKMRGMYDSYPTTGTQHRPLGPASTVPAPGSAFSDPHQHNHLPLHQQQQQQQQHVQARIIDRKYRSPAAAAAGTTYVAHPLSHSQSLSHSQYTHVSSSGGVRGAGKDRTSGSRGSGRQGEDQGGQGQGHSRSGSHSSASSMDVDEMIIKASTEGGDGSTSIPPVNGGSVTAPGQPARWGGEGSHLAGAHAHSFLVGGGGGGGQQQYSTTTTSSHAHHHRRRSDRDRESPASAGGANVYPNTSGQSFNAGNSNTGSGSAMRVLSERDGGREGRSYTQTVFAPVVTGAPTKKSKYPNSMGSSASLDTLANPGSSSSSNLNPNSNANPNANANAGQQPNKTTPYPATNDNGERICRTCGIVGRYKDGKCVEKWGPGVMGPGTVCDRCRKKAKRDEGRQVQQQQQQQQLQPRSNSHAQLPLSQGSDRSIQRSDTILTQQPSSHSFIQSRNDREPDSLPNLRSSTASSSATFKARAAPASTAGRHAPTPPTIASLREKHEDDDEDDDEDGDGGDGDGHNTAAVARGRDPEQLPTSNVGRGVAAVKAASSKNNSRSNSRNRRVRPGSAKPTPPATTESSHRNNGSGLAGGLKKGSTSPSNAMIVDDEVDADADEDAEAEAEAEILGAVDAAAAEGDGDDADGDGDGEGDLENDADADAELLEAVDAAEANSIGSSHGGDRSSWLTLKSEPI